MPHLNENGQDQNTKIPDSPQFVNIMFRPIADGLANADRAIWDTFYEDHLLIFFEKKIRFNLDFDVKDYLMYVLLLPFLKKPRFKELKTS